MIKSRKQDGSTSLQVEQKWSQNVFQERETLGPVVTKTQPLQADSEAKKGLSHLFPQLPAAWLHPVLQEEEAEVGGLPTPC